MDPITILALLSKSLEIAATLRAQAKAAGISDERLAEIDANYDVRIAAREAEAQPPVTDGD